MSGVFIQRSTGVHSSAVATVSTTANAAESQMLFATKRRSSASSPLAEFLRHGDDETVADADAEAEHQKN